MSFLTAVNGLTGPDVTIIDDFEDGDITEYGGDTGNFAVVQSPVQNGSNALESQTGGAVISSTTGLSTYPGQGDTFRFYCQNPSSGGRIYTYFGTQSESNTPAGYRIGVRPGIDDFLLQRNDGSGGSTVLGSTSVSLSTGVWYRVNVTWQTDGTIDATLFDSGSQIANISTTDTTYTDGGIGFEEDIAPAVWDYYHIP
jgi:hypothetical protein